jgi:hypothetical protein
MPLPGRNPALIRAVNERIREVSSTWGAASEPVGFLCECGDMDCLGVLKLTIGDFETVRSAEEHFLLVRDHESPDADEVVSRNNGYVIVAKRGADRG